jgi:hypothetical protein
MINAKGKRSHALGFYVGDQRVQAQQNGLAKLRRIEGHGRLFPGAAPWRA